MIINYFISPEMHETAFKMAGFSNFKWAPLELYPEADLAFWHDYFNRKDLPVIGMIVIKWN